MATPDVTALVIAVFVIVALLLFIRLDVWQRRCLVARRQRDQLQAERDGLVQQLDYYHQITDIASATLSVIRRSAR
jgi:hypothetical protein